MKSDIGFIFIYIAGFGFSDFIVDKTDLDGLLLFSYYIFIFTVGIIFLWLDRTEHRIQQANNS